MDDSRTGTNHEPHGQDMMRSLEVNVASTIGESYAQELATVDDALGQMLVGLAEVVRLPPDSTMNHARTILAARAYNSMRSARILLQLGYHEQVLALMRIGLESYMTIACVEDNSKTAKRVINGGEVSVRTIKGNPKNNDFIPVYDYLSDYVHSSGQAALPVGSMYYAPLFLPVLRLYVEILRGAMYLVFKVTSPTDGWSAVMRESWQALTVLEEYLSQQLDGPDEADR